MTTPTFAAVIKRASLAGVLAATLLSGSARAQVVAVFPPPAFVASAVPVYYEGHATYWWGNRWYWRDPYGWHVYAAEPPFLFQWRGHHEFGRRFYEPRGRFHR
jgi:hypothetical protein